MLTIYKASAGSGKTFTLALEYIKLLLGIKAEDGHYYLNSNTHAPDRCRVANRHRGILAVTFTNKATEEMKARIIKEIDALKHIPAPGSKDSNYAPILTAQFKCSREELAEAADLALSELLTDYMHFNVSTIDSFFQTVLRTFAREVDRQGDYDIELNDTLAVNIGVGLMLDDLNYGNSSANKRMRSWITGFTQRQIVDNKAFNVFNRTSKVLGSLTGYVNAISSEQFKTFADQTLQYIEQDPNLRRFRTALQDRITRLTDESTALATDTIRAWNDTGYDDAALGNILDVLGLFRDKEQVKLDRFALKKVVAAMNPDEDHNCIYTKKYCPQQGKTPIYPDESFTEGLCQTLVTLYQNTVDINVLTQILDACDGLEFIGFTWKYIDQFRKDNNLILLSDTNDLIYRIIKNSDMPFIYERLGVTLTNFLIDEFQDTSHLQWRNLKPLVENSIDDQHDNLIIGDEKQAIYRFRNSDSSMLHYSVANVDFPNDSEVKGKAPGENTNYRSASDIVRFNNAMFKRIANDLNLEVYDNVAQSLPKRSPEEEQEFNAYISLTDIAQLVSDENGFTAEYRLTAEAIKRQHDAGYKWRDIVVLVRMRKEAIKIINYLMEYYPEIQLASEEALLLYNAQSVRLIVSLLKLLDLSYQSDNEKIELTAQDYGSLQDTLMMMSRFEYNMGNINRDLTSSQSASEALLAALNPDQYSAEAIRREVNEIRDKKPSNLIALVETIIELRITPEQRAKEFAYIAAFQDTVIDYCAHNNPSIHSFTTWWDENKEKLAVTASAESDAVSIMTIHKAKGLEWPCVHIPFANWPLTKNNDAIWAELSAIEQYGITEHPPVIYLNNSDALRHDKSYLKAQFLKDIDEQLIDNLNTAYVALTRPSRELCMCYNTAESGFDRLLSSLLYKALLCKSTEISPDDNPELYMDLNIYFDPETSTFCFGEPTVPMKGKEKPRQLSARVVPPYVVVHRPDTAKLTTIEDAVSLKSSLDIGNDEDKAHDDETPVKEKTTKISDDEYNRRAQRGIWLHSVLADMVNLRDLDAALLRKKAQVPIDDDLFDEYHQILVDAFDRVPQYRDRWFVNYDDILTESAIYDPEPDLVLRPDRMVFMEDGSIEIIDYKFTSEMQAAHHNQVTTYVRLMQQMGYDRVSGYIWYPEKGEVIKV